MPRYSVTGAVHASTYIGEYDANTPEEAIELAYNDAGVSLCHQCSRKISDPEVCELTAEDVETGDATSEATTNDQVTEQAEEIKRLRADRDAAQQMVAELRAALVTARDVVIEISRRHTRWVEGAYDTLEASAPIAGRWCLASERDEALRLLATRVEAKRLDEAQEEIAALRAACTLALGIMEQKNKVNVPPFAKFITVDFAPEDVAVLRAALEKKP